jgi:dTDP-4-amino-4,6-dideoxygalactose transaminase
MPVLQPARRSRRSKFLQFSTPAIGDEEMAEVADTLRSGWLTTGPKTARFEAAFRDRVDAPDALGLNSCTAGLHIGLRVLGVRPGDEVITSPLSFCACANVIEHLGARPVFADVERETLNIDPRTVAAAITPRTRVILVTHYAGHPVDLAPIQEIAAEHGLGLLEDAADAFPASYRGRMVGSSDHLVSFSFYATKNLTTGEGGMLTGPSEALTKARVLTLRGMTREAWKRTGPAGLYEVREPGFKHGMTDLQAAIGLAQLQKLDRFQHRRREIVARYSEAFAREDALEIPIARPEVEHAWHLYVLRLRLGALRISRDHFIQELTARDIGTSVHFLPLHLHPFYRQKYGYLPHTFPVAYNDYQRMLSLPLHPGLANDDVTDVIAAVLDVTRRFAR